MTTVIPSCPLILHHALLFAIHPAKPSESVTVKIPFLLTAATRISRSKSKLSVLRAETNNNPYKKTEE